MLPYYDWNTDKWVWCAGVREAHENSTNFFTFYLPGNKGGLCFGGVHYAMRMKRNAPLFAEIQMRDAVSGLRVSMSARERNELKEFVQMKVKMKGGESVFVIRNKCLYEIKWEGKKVAVMERHLPWVRDCEEICDTMQSDGGDDALLIRCQTNPICVYYPRKQIFCSIFDKLTNEVQNELKNTVMQSVQWLPANNHLSSSPLLLIQTKKIHGCLSIDGNIILHDIIPNHAQHVSAYYNQQQYEESIKFNTFTPQNINAFEKKMIRYIGSRPDIEYP